MSRYRDPHPQMGDNYIIIYLYNLIRNISQSSNFNAYNFLL